MFVGYFVIFWLKMHTKTSISELPNYLSVCFSYYFSGTIYTNGSIQYQQSQEILQLVVIATDNGDNPLSAVTAVYIQITSVNKYSPKFKETNYS